MNELRRFTAAILTTGSIAFASYAGAADKAAAPSPAFTPAQLEQLVAPIALYPDSPMAQILMASTYPLEIVEASRWVKKNPGLEGDALDAALKDEDWDPSVKSLCTLPDVLQRMNDNLDWTQDLGDAFLAQQADVLDTVQRMRAKAYAAGNLKTSEQQTVVVEKKEGTQVIVVQQASPQVVYVPTYSPAVVYGPTWTYPTPYYPAMYAPPGYGLLAFGAGMAVGAAIWGDCNWGYGHGSSNVNVNVNNYNNFNSRTNINTGNINTGNINSGNWNHNPEHRKGVNYKNSQTAQKYGAAAGQARVTQNQARGYGDGATNRPGASASTRPAGGTASRPPAASTGGGSNRPGSSGGASNRAAGGATNRATGSGAGSASRGSAAATRPSSSTRGSSGGGGAFSSSGSAGLDRASSSRGASSRGGGGGGGARSSGSGGSRGGGGGGSRGGGGGGSRGGGRGR